MNIQRYGKRIQRILPVLKGFYLERLAVIPTIFAERITKTLEFKDPAWLDDKRIVPKGSREETKTANERSREETQTANGRSNETTGESRLPITTNKVRNLQERSRFGGTQKRLERNKTTTG